MEKLRFITKQNLMHHVQETIRQFYELVTGETDAFYQLCMALPECIEQALAHSEEISLPKDSVLDELRTSAKASNGTLLLALYMLGFSSYLGFKSK